jgi:hypothetical protein
MMTIPESNATVFQTAWNYHVVRAMPLGYDAVSQVCSYGDGCAIGCQPMPDDLRERLIAYETQTKTPVNESSNGIERAIKYVEGLADYFGNCELPFLQELQRAHDFACEGKVSIQEMYELVAEVWNISIPLEQRGPRFVVKLETQNGVRILANTATPVHSSERGEQTYAELVENSDEEQVDSLCKAIRETKREDYEAGRFYTFYSSTGNPYTTRFQKIISEVAQSKRETTNHP